MIEKFRPNLRDSSEEDWNDKSNINESFKRMICQQSTEMDYSRERLEAERFA